MPLRINLLAEQHALEELRRRDPVKRALWIGVLLAAMVLVWSSSLLTKSIIGKSELSRLEADLNSRTNDYRQILDNKRQLDEINLRLHALDRLATNRFLIGNLLNSLQQAAISDVQLTHARLDQSYFVTEEVRAKDSSSKSKPATSTEKITLTLDAKDLSSDAGGSIGKYQERLSNLPYFQSLFGKPVEISLKQRGTPQPDADGRTAVVFSLECRFPDKTR